VWRRALLLAVPLVFVAAPAFADDCGNPSDCEETGGFIGITAVVGGVGAVAAAAAAALANADAEPGEELEFAIVQVSTDRVEVAKDLPGTFDVTAWIATEAGQRRAPEIPLTVHVPPMPGLTVSPAVGSGEMHVEVAVDETAENGEVPVVVSGEYKGRRAQQTVTIVIGGEYVLEVL